MKTRRGKIIHNTAVVAAMALLQLAGIAAKADTCMTEDLFLYVAPKKESAKPARSGARSGKKTVGAGIAVLGTKDPQNSSNHSKAKNDRGDDRQKIAGRN